MRRSEPGAGSPALSLGEVNDLVLAAGRPPGRLYLAAMAGLLALAGAAGLAWMYQVRTGMGVAGVSHPVGWGVYIGNLVFWLGIAHSGTLISAILHLMRARWRDSVSRAAEAMTVLAVSTAGLFPLVHLGRLWAFYYIVPYPSQRRLWPNFMSPLVWDLVAIGTYFTVSATFFYVGLIPDLAAVRDRAERERGPDHWRSRLFRILALGWSGAAGQWRHYGRSYLFFAALATPLVVSVHSVVSWDFAVSILPGWHTTIFAPYFVAGAIHSGLAMVLTLMIPMRRLLGLERLITVSDLEKVAQTLLVTTAIVAYAYLVEPFIAWYSGDVFERQFAAWRATGSLAWAYWALLPLNVLAPLAFVFRRVRRSLAALFIVSIIINIGMWLERAHIVVASTSHDFLPHAWGSYTPTWVEAVITAGSLALFLALFLAFAKLLPPVPMADVKEHLAGQSAGAGAPEPTRPSRAGTRRVARGDGSVLAIYDRPERLLGALDRLLEAGFAEVEVFSPVRLESVDRRLGARSSPVRFWTLAGALAGLAGGFGLTIGTSLVNRLVVGGKPPLSLIPYCVIAFELTILGGALANLAGLLFHARLPGRRRRGYDPRFSRDKFGLLAGCPPAELATLRSLLAEGSPEEVRDAH